MSLQEIIISLSPGQKLFYGFVGGILIYLFFRYLIHLANKEALKINAPKKNKDIAYFKRVAKEQGF